MAFLRFLFVLFFRRPAVEGITAKVVADSIATYFFGAEMHLGNRVTTFQLRYPRFIHAELMTHRVFSRNASSSRAIPVMTMLKEILLDPAMPIYWGANQSGMQAKSELSGLKRRLAIRVWRLARYPAVFAAFIAYKIGLHKQIANRICEPWAHISVVVTATEYQNWFNLRLHADAQPEIRHLAGMMDLARSISTPRRLNAGEWHLPYVRSFERNNLSSEDAIKVSVARCARVSYLTHDKQMPSIEQDIALYERLVGSVPLHASPAEHQAKPDVFDTPNPVKTYGTDWARDRNHYDNLWLHGNLVGWVQYRKLLPSEFIAG